MIDVYFLVKNRIPQKGDEYEIICSFEDGYDAFLQRIFLKLNDSLGRTIVYDNGVFFHPEDLGILSEVLSETRQRMKAKPESWDVSLGWVQTKKGQRKREIYSEATQIKMKQLLTKVEESVCKARSTDGHIWFNFWGGGG